MTWQAMFGATTLIIAISALAALLPATSIIQAAFSVSRRGACGLISARGARITRGAHYEPAAEGHARGAGDDDRDQGEKRRDGVGPVVRGISHQQARTEALGLATYDARPEPLFLNGPTLPGPRTFSDRTAEAIDGEVRRLLDEDLAVLIQRGIGATQRAFQQRGHAHPQAHALGHLRGQRQSTLQHLQQV